MSPTRREFIAGTAAAVTGASIASSGAAQSDTPENVVGITIDIEQTTSPVVGGERLDVLAQVGNNTSTELVETVKMYDSSGTLLDSAEVTIDGHATRFVELGYETYPVSVDVEFPIMVTTAVDEDIEMVTVYGTDD